MPRPSAIKKKLPCQITLRRTQVPTLSPLSFQFWISPPPISSCNLLFPITFGCKISAAAAASASFFSPSPFAEPVLDPAISGVPPALPAPSLNQRQLMELSSHPVPSRTSSPTTNSSPCTQNTGSWITPTMYSTKCPGEIPSHGHIWLFENRPHQDRHRLFPINAHYQVYRVEENVSNIFVSNSLINLYAKCGMMVDAERVFGGMMHPNMVSWSSLLSGYYQHGEGREALSVFSRAQKVGMEVNEFLLAGMVKACAGIRNLAIGEVLHCYFLKCWIGSDGFVETKIIDMFIACGDVEYTKLTFLEIVDPGLASWAVLAGGYAQHGQGEKAMSLFKKLHSLGMIPNEHIFLTILAAC